MSEPQTEAGRRLLADWDHFWPGEPRPDEERLLAIEIEAASESYVHALADVRREVENTETTLTGQHATGWYQALNVCLAILDRLAEPQR